MKQHGIHGEYCEVRGPYLATNEWRVRNKNLLGARQNEIWPMDDSGQRRSHAGIPVHRLHHDDLQTGDGWRELKESERYTWEIFGLNYQTSIVVARRVIELANSPPGYLEFLRDQLHLNAGINSFYLWDEENECRPSPYTLPTHALYNTFEHGNWYG